MKIYLLKRVLKDFDKEDYLSFIHHYKLSDMNVLEMEDLDIEVLEQIVLGSDKVEVMD